MVTSARRSSRRRERDGAVTRTRPIPTYAELRRTPWPRGPASPAGFVLSSPPPALGDSGKGSSVHRRLGRHRQTIATGRASLTGRGRSRSLGCRSIPSLVRRDPLTKGEEASLYEARSVPAEFS